jgi:polyphosphate kinase 2 (PPK2 family)
MAQQNIDTHNEYLDSTRDVDERPKLKRKEYEKILRELQTELCSVQDWIKQTGQRIIVVFEGRDAAGKGGTIRAMTERVSPLSLCRPLQIGKNRKCMCSAISLTFLRPARS